MRLRHVHKFVPTLWTPHVRSIHPSASISRRQRWTCRPETPARLDRLEIDGQHKPVSVFA
jgi:hypothetical protein